MNWYKLTKIAQIWTYNVPEYEGLEYGVDRMFSSWLKQLYEMEYKYNMVLQHFNGMPQRKENILNNIKSSLTDAAEQVVDALKKTIYNWLQKHAILSPKTWADSRANDVEEMEGEIGKDGFTGMISEYAQYAFYKNQYNPNFNPNNFWYKMVREAQQHLDKFPSFKRLLELFLLDYKENERAQANENLQDFSERYDKEFKDINEAELFVKSLTVDDADIESLIMSDDLDSFVSAAESQGLATEILSEFYEYFVFPVWFNKWSAEGIEETRENVENVYKELENISYEDTGNMMATISNALNVSHQNGEMLDYLEQDTNEDNLKGTLDELTAGNFIPSVNEELKEIGVITEEPQVEQGKQPKQQKQPKQPKQPAEKPKAKKAPKKQIAPKKRKALKSAISIKDLRLVSMNKLNWYEIAKESN